MDWQTFINVGAGLALFIVGGYTRRVQSDNDKIDTRIVANSKRLEDIRAEIANLRFEMARDYVTHADLREIREVLARIEDKLDRKVDK